MRYYEDIVIGQQSRTREYHVSKDELINFAKEWGPQPFHIDEEAAKNWPTGLIGTSVHSYAIINKLFAEIAAQGEDPIAMVAGLGIDEWRTPNPLRPGDTVHAVGYVKAKRESSSKPNLGILTSVSTLVNQNGETILTYKSNGLVMKRPQ